MTAARGSRYCSAHCKTFPQMLRSIVREACLSLRQRARELHVEYCRGQAQLRRDEREARLSRGRMCRLCGAWFFLEKRVRWTECGNNRKHCQDCRAINDRLVRYECEAEAVNPYAVFVRDKWHCQHCGCATPKRLRGSDALNAPVLDHILPVSKGGAHSYANTQCLCVLCNSKKGASTAREPKLAGVVDLTPYKIARVKATERERLKLCRKSEAFSWVEREGCDSLTARQRRMKKACANRRFAYLAD